MKFHITLILLLVGLTTIFAQNDVIVLKTGVEIPSKIIELGPKEIKYKELDNLDGPIISIEKATVFMLRYANGKTKVINPITDELVEPKPNKEVEPNLIPKIEAQPTPSVSKPPTVLRAFGTKKDKGFTYGGYIGLSLPLGNYAIKNIDRNEDVAGAKLGYAFGSLLGYRFNKNFSLLCEFLYSVNSYEIEVRDVRNIYTLNGDWKHTAIMPSIKIETPITEKLNFYGMASAGVSISTIDGDFADVLDILGTETTTGGFGYSITFGLVYKFTNFGIKYIGSNPVFADYKPKISTLQITFGYQF